MNSRSGSGFTSYLINNAGKIVALMTAASFMAKGAFEICYTSGKQKQRLQKQNEISKELNTQAKEKTEESYEVTTALHVANKEIEISNRIKALTIEKQNATIAELLEKLKVLEKKAASRKPTLLAEKHNPSLEHEVNHNDEFTFVTDEDMQTSITPESHSVFSFLSAAVLFPAKKTSNNKLLREYEIAHDEMKTELEDSDKALSVAKERLAASEEIILRDRENALREDKLCQKIN